MIPQPQCDQCGKPVNVRTISPLKWWVCSVECNDAYETRRALEAEYERGRDYSGLIPDLPAATLDQIAKLVGVTRGPEESDEHLNARATVALQNGSAKWLG